MCQPDAAVASRQTIGGQALQQRSGVRPADLELGERAEVGHADPLTHTANLGAHNVMRIRPAKRMRLRGGVGREVLRALPPVDLLPLSTHGVEAPPQRCGLDGPAGGSLLAGQPHLVHLVVLVDGLVESELRLRAGVIAETARIHAAHVDLGLAVDHPLRQVLPRSRTLGDADGRPVAVPVVAHTRGGPHEIARIGGVRDRPRHHLFDAGIGQRADALLREVQTLLEDVEILAGQMEVQVPVDALDAVGPGAGHLIGPDEQPVDLLPVVAGRSRVPHDRQFEVERLDIGHRLGHQVLVDDRHDRHVESDHGAELRCVVASSVHDVLAMDGVLLVVAVRPVAAPPRLGPATDDAYVPAAVGTLGHAGHQRVTHDAASEIASTLCHGVGAARRVGPAVVGCVEAESDIVEIGQQGVPLGDLVRSDEVRLHTDLGEHGVDVPVPVDLLRRSGQPDRSAAMPPGRQPGLGLDAGVERNGLLVDLGHVEVADEVRYEARGVPCGAGGELALLDQDRVGPALVREGIQQTSAHRPAADDHATRLFRHAQRCRACSAIDRSPFVQARREPNPPVRTPWHADVVRANYHPTAHHCAHLRARLCNLKLELSDCRANCTPTCGLAGWWGRRSCGSRAWRRCGVRRSRCRRIRRRARTW